MHKKAIPKESQEHLKSLINAHLSHSIQTKLLRLKHLLQLFINIEILCKNSKVNMLIRKNNTLFSKEYNYFSEFAQKHSLFSFQEYSSS